jgi:rhamnogalacturonyl hydrolase YesR
LAIVLRTLRVILTLALVTLPAAGIEHTAVATEDVAYLEHARGAERWLRQQAVTTSSGKIWRSADERDDHPVTNGNLYYGSSGVILFYLELYQQTGDPTFLQQAEDGAAYLMASVPSERA